MKITLALFIFSITVYQPAIAAIGVTSDKNIKPVPYDKRQEPAETQKNIISEDSRARNLYQNHCTSCHESIVFIRANRKAKNYEDLSYWVNQRADWLNLNWSYQERQEVLQYLNKRFYKYPIIE